MTALVIAADSWTAARAANELGLVAWHVPGEYRPLPVEAVIWVDGWRLSATPVGGITMPLLASPSARHMVYQLHGETELAQAARAARRLDHDRAVRAAQRTLATLPPTISPESLAAASTITPERTPWWRRLFRKAAR